MEKRTRRQEKKPKQAPRFLPKRNEQSTKDEITARAKRSWGPIIVDVALMLIWVFAVIMAAQFIVGYIMIWILGPERLAQPVWMTIYSAVVYTLAMVLIIFSPQAASLGRKNTHEIKKGKTASPDVGLQTDRVELGLRGLPTWTDIGLAPVGFIVYLLLAAGCVALFSLFPWFDAEQAQELGFNTYIVGFDRVVAFLTLVVIAPVAEEIIFRGWLYGKMRGKINKKTSDLFSMIISIFLVSLLFGIVHLQWNVGVNVFAMSIVLCGLREITGTIYSGILLHMLKNGVAFYLLFVLGI